jgi:hypothetical protein
MARVSKKTRPRRSAPSSKAAGNKTAANKAAARSATVSKAAEGRAPASTPAGRAPASTPAESGRIEADAIARRMLDSLWASVADGDLLRAELETATCMAVPHVAGQHDPEEIEAFVSNALVDKAVARQTPDAAALLRVLMSLGTPNIKQLASRALAELTGGGVYPPEWVTEIGKVTPGQAWRRYDVFGDDEAVAATFSYGETEHAIVVQVDLTGIPIATAVGVASSAPGLIEAMQRIAEEDFDRAEQISLAEARRRTEAPLALCDRERDPSLGTDTVAYLPIAKSRVRRLPAADTEPAAEFTAADRAAAVDDFMKSPLAADAVAADEDSTRFWAQVLTGYSSRVPGEPPAQVGPRKLVHILLGHVPNTFDVSAAQREHLEAAVTAWARWSAAQRHLTEAETARLLESLPDAFSRFDAAYDDRDSVTIRGYVADLADSDADVSWLSRSVGRRMFALPVLEFRDGQPAVGTPAERRSRVEAEFGGCNPPAGMTGEQLVDAVYGVIEELWHDDANTTFDTARRLFAEGINRHDVIHRLAGSPATTRSTSILQEEFSARSMSS